jgi:23S rRNA (cytosine1962-C5)-methyltransferase
MKGKTVTQEQNTAIKNRLIKNKKKLKAYLEKNNIEAFRLYNKDIPEYPYLIDIYHDRAVIYEQGKKLGDDQEQMRATHQTDIQRALSEALNIDSSKQYFKTREKQKGNNQYNPLDPTSQDFFTVNEPPFKFLVNLERYLDTGLFLDHRPLRQFIFTQTRDKKVLNLFCYTGSISVAAALGGGVVTSIDMSNTYLDWAYENFLVNKINPKPHVFYQADVLKELVVRKERQETFDIIILDPPSFSNSKRMEEDLDIERDHPILIRDCMALLSEGGTLYFSTNKKKFELHRIIPATYSVKEISQWTIPQDFHQSSIHRSFAIERKKT